MGSSTQTSVTILDVHRVNPAPNPPKFSTPLTFFDAMFLYFPSAKTIFFYQLSDPTPTHFNSVIVPRLRHALSLALAHFPPLAGRITWPARDLKPVILYMPNEDYHVSLTVAECINNPESFSQLVGRKPYKATESSLYVPELHVTDSEAAAMSLQVTLFANHGMAIGVNLHHAVVDGKGFVLFMKDWAHMNRKLEASATLVLPPELAPALDRSVVPNPEAVWLKVMDRWDGLMPRASSRRRSLNVNLPIFDPNPTSSVRASFEVSLEDATKLKDLVASSNVDLRMSTFVLAYSYTLTCLLKARKKKNTDSFKRVVCFTPAECRAHFNPPLPDNYFGNCLMGCFLPVGADAVLGQDGFVAVAKSVREGIEAVKSRKNSDYDDRIMPGRPFQIGDVLVAVAGSPRLEFYATDFGWGRPSNVEFAHISDAGTISITERRDGSGGVEITLVLPVDEMEVFNSLFVAGLKD